MIRAGISACIFFTDLAKSIYSAVLLDLGQEKGDFTSNIVTDPDTLASYSMVLSNYGYGGHAREEVGPASRRYSALDNTYGPLGITRQSSRANTCAKCHGETPPVTSWSRCS